MKKTSSFCLGLLGMVALSLVCPQQAKALDSQYLRNGECYLLIGEGSTALRGVYRLNNPAANPAKYYNDNRVIPGGSINNTLGFNVDLNRNIYTFTENVDASWTKDSSPIYRQVVDTVPANDVDYGYHAWIHYDHRQWGQGDIYRTGPVGRRIKNDYGGWWGGFNSAGPGTPVNKPAGYTLPSMSGAAYCPEYSGKQWYQIPNYSWYSSWRTGTADPYWNGYYTFYYVYGDRVQVKNHNYYLWTWSPNNAELDTPSYSKNTGNIVAKTKEEQISRDCLAGCLDGCGGASGSGSASPKPLLNDIAFQPPIKNQTSRTYFYSRSQGGTDGKVTKNNSSYNPGSSNPLIGGRDNTDTFWLCISLRNASTDFVYCLGTTVIKDWYKQAFGSAPSNMNITAVTVSNQWDQQGGIVYAYDKANKKIYKFERKETSGTPISKERFLALDLSAILSEIDAVSNSEFDDIKADGFGSLYFAMSHPSKTISAYNPIYHFKPSDCIHVHPTTHDSSKGEQAFLMIFKQNYGKKVFERNYLTGEIKEVGSKDFATRIYNVSCKIKDAGWNVIKNYPSGCSFSRLNTELASWSATVAGYTYKQATNSWPSSYYQYGKGSCNHYTELNYNDPGQAKLAVINVPTPPKVISLGGKKSYLDIVGPYKDMIPLADKVERTTNQGDGLMSANSNLSTDQLYFYMVENYPLDDGAQDPTIQPNWDNDNRRGGFITSIQDPAPYRPGTHSSGVQYIWKTWMVMDLYGNCVCRLSQSVEAKDGNPYNFIYSPVYGKFIMTCQVKYNWYDYDALSFGSTVDDLSSVLHSHSSGDTSCIAIPVSTNGIEAQWASDRLTQIKNSFKFSGTMTNKNGDTIVKNNVAFMNNPFNQFGDPITVDYSPIISSANGGQYLALEPISVGNIIGTQPPPPLVVFPITRCDTIPGVATSSYMNTDSYWSQVPSDDKTFGIAAGEEYNWRIDKAAQAYMFKDVSKFNSTNPSDVNYNYLAHQMITPGSDFYVNKKANFKFLNQGGDLKWADKKILVSAKLIYKVPNGNTYKEISLPLKQALDTSSSIGSDYEFEYTVKDEANLWQKNLPVYYTTAGNLPPTDPMDAKIQITMRRQYQYDMWAYYNGAPSFPVVDLPGWFKITGEAKVRIIDTTKPKIAWGETKPNNLFGKTGEELKGGIGPNGMVNPANINFTVTDNNPWEGVEVQTGLSIDNHIRNINYNYGYAYCQSYCANNEYLSTRFKNLGLSPTTGIRTDIENKKKSGQKTSHLNYKQLFSRQARDVRLGFETVARTKSTNARFNGKVTLGKVDSLFGQNGTLFSTEGQSKYAVHYRSGSDHNAKYQKSLVLSSMSYSRTVGATTVYDARMVYTLPVSSIEISPTDPVKKNKIPDGYANNTPGYRDGNKIRPYKFYVSLTDSSGNYTGERELNLVLNVKDVIPPVGYGSVTNSKDNQTSYFPSETTGVNYSNDPDKAPSYCVNDEYYFYHVLDDTFIRGRDWASTEANGIVKYNNINGPYRAMTPMGDNITSSIDPKGTSVFMTQVRNKISPQAVEDNVECQFNVYVSDNCGNATATLALKQYDTDGRNGSQAEVAKSVTTLKGWVSAASVDGSTKSEIASSTSTLYTLFRGNSGQFPMAIPITITSEDDARDWDYYLGGSENDSGGWTWGTVHFGEKINNLRTFKTVLPVFGSELDIRTLDKTIQNQR